jgi:CMP-N-acetylneuraminic acid synthetase
MRHHSVRVPGKNYRSLGGVPLFHHILQTLRRCPSVSRIVIDTDSDVIRKDTEENFPEVQLVDRPQHLRADTVPMTEILCHDASLVPAEIYLQTHSTNPFLKSETIEAALSRWFETRQEYDSLFSVTRIQARLWDSALRPMNHNPDELLRTQDLKPVYLENSNFYIFPSELIKSKRRRIGERPFIFEVDPIEAIDIDDEQTFGLAENIMASKTAKTR